MKFEVFPDENIPGRFFVPGYLQVSPHDPKPQKDRGKKVKSYSAGSRPFGRARMLYRLQGNRADTLLYMDCRGTGKVTRIS
jgi:hypothetical protein